MLDNVLEACTLYTPYALPVNLTLLNAKHIHIYIPQ